MRLARKPISRDGETRPALMALLGVWSWLNLPRAILEHAAVASSSAEERIRAYIIIHALGHEYDGVDHFVEVNGRTLPYCVRWVRRRENGKDVQRIEEVSQADIANATGTDEGTVSRVVAHLKRQGFLAEGTGRLICLVPEPPVELKPDQEVRKNLACTPRFPNLPPAISTIYEEGLRAIKHWKNARHRRFMAALRRRERQKIAALEEQIQALLVQQGISDLEGGVNTEPPQEPAAACEPKPPAEATTSPTEPAAAGEILAVAEQPPPAEVSAPDSSIETLDGFDDALTSAFDEHGKPLPTRRQVEQAFASLPPGSREAYLADLTSPSNGRQSRIDRMTHPGALKEDVAEFVRRRWPRLKEKLEAARRQQAAWEARQAEEEARLAAEIAARPPNQREDWEEEFLRDYGSRYRHRPKAHRAGGVT